MSGTAGVGGGVGRAGKEWWRERRSRRGRVAGGMRLLKSISAVDKETRKVRTVTTALWLWCLEGIVRREEISTLQPGNYCKLQFVAVS